ncbi:MAG: flavodoxin-dependent (E)-4-hydroxy-3-methylbut-2-enyl-diphosphate synthase [Peptococcaceae bacterium]|nr:flavodoxin-dependent (E)-4-hydroxy-3-methylbut-2-enyl-diphosphate synthase [Peptococcaceae bacterium]
MYPRQDTVPVQVGGLIIGGGAPIVIQSMTNTATEDVQNTLKQIVALSRAGCGLVRIAVPHDEARKALAELVSKSPVPLEADIHFDHRLAIGSLEMGVAKVRINPGNIGSNSKVKEVIAAASRRGAAVRIGVNSGSLPSSILAKYGGPTAEALVEAALQYERQITAWGFANLVFSLKSSDVLKTVRANELFSRSSRFPLHIGITEAGTRLKGAVRTAVGLSLLLSQGIGDTLRVSLTADPLDEVVVAKEILASMGLYPKQLHIVSCPTCGRTAGDLISLAERVELELEDLAMIPLRIAVMGCAVNGPGEAKEADLGIALSQDKAVLFRRGQIVDILPLESAAVRLVAEARQMAFNLTN